MYILLYMALRPWYLSSGYITKLGKGRWHTKVDLYKTKEKAFVDLHCITFSLKYIYGSRCVFIFFKVSTFLRRKKQIHVNWIKCYHLFFPYCFYLSQNSLINIYISKKESNKYKGVLNFSRGWNKTSELLLFLSMGNWPEWLF